MEEIEKTFSRNVNRFQRAQLKGEGGGDIRDEKHPGVILRNRKKTKKVCIQVRG